MKILARYSPCFCFLFDFTIMLSMYIFSVLLIFASKILFIIFLFVVHMFFKPKGHETVSLVGTFTHESNFVSVLFVRTNLVIFEVHLCTC